jgi:hypothetical protein
MSDNGEAFPEDVAEAFPEDVAEAFPEAFPASPSSGKWPDSFPNSTTSARLSRIPRFPEMAESFPAVTQLRIVRGDTPRSFPAEAEEIYGESGESSFMTA